MHLSWRFCLPRRGLLGPRGIQGLSVQPDRLDLRDLRGFKALKGLRDQMDLAGFRDKQAHRERLAHRGQLGLPGSKELLVRSARKAPSDQRE